MKKCYCFFGKDQFEIYRFKKRRVPFATILYQNVVLVSAVSTSAFFVKCLDLGFAFFFKDAESHSLEWMKYFFLLKDLKSRPKQAVVQVDITELFPPFKLYAKKSWYRFNFAKALEEIRTGKKFTLEDEGED